MPSENFTDRFEQELSRKADAILARALDEIDIRASAQVEQLVQDAMALLLQSMDGAGPGIGSGGNLSAQFSQSINRMVESAITLGLGSSRERTSTSTVETSRSVNASDGYKASRAQQQSEAAQALQKGTRNQ